MCRAVFALFLTLCALSSKAVSPDSVMAQALRDMGDVPFYDGCAMRLLPSGQEKYDDLFSAVREAKDYVHMEYFKFFNDSIGSRLLCLLHAKAREGVDVRVLIDGFGNKTKPHNFSAATLDSVRALGIKIDIYKPIGRLQLARYFHRDHRKIVVIDGRVGYLGGMNVADYYIVGKPSVGTWKDMHVRVEGAVVDGLEAIFRRMWFEQTGEMVVVPPATRLASCSSSCISVHRMALVNRAPGRLSRQGRMAMALAFDAARDSVCLVNPYPTNIPFLRRAIVRALKRGVKVKIMVSAKSDIAVTPDVVGIEMRRLMRHGAQIFYCEQGFHHDKYMTVDGLFATVGTTNLDGRSLRFDHEVNLFLFDRQATRALDNQMKRELPLCTRLTSAGWRQRFSLWHRVIGRVASLGRWLF